VSRQQNQELDCFLSDEQIPRRQAKPKKLYAAVDGVTAYETHSWHKAGFGGIYFVDEQFERYKRYIGHFDTSQTFR